MKIAIIEWSVILLNRELIYIYTHLYILERKKILKLHLPAGEVEKKT
jgi:hypothetical protein